ncbi:hypothetical protein MBCUT_08550 [Methanobrevibacter cuticularis]|uniref:Uncharacterized protein n=1 Tax=Methanobrevibacter cuticularis TaxID=47311 RepID=A0A166EBA4_9EURY|nr:hypothetical protein [Methanobrevibacter cuticularis]KZX16469.1 hypothetical protein MBCUT_08550 [Methanobrevibacter cuticularis]
MAEAFSGILIFSHIIPVILGFFGILALINGIMDDKKEVTIIGIVLFLIAVSLPFIILPVIFSL